MEEKNKKNINRRDFIKIVGISAGSFLGGIVCDKGQISHIGFVGAAFAVISVLFFLVCMSKNLVENK